MGLDPTGVGAIAGAIKSTVDLAQGFIQNHRRKKAINSALDRINNLQQPMYNIPSLYGDNLGLAEQNASQGLSQDSLNAFTQNNQQNFASATNAILQGGGSINDIGKLYGQANTAEVGLIAQDEALRDKHLEQLYERRQEMAGQLTTQWRLNYYNRWKDQAAANAMLLQGAVGMPTGAQSIKEGVTGAVDTGLQAYDDGLFNGLWGNKNDSSHSTNIANGNSW